MMKGKGGTSDWPWAVDVSNRLGGDHSLSTFFLTFLLLTLKA